MNAEHIINRNYPWCDENDDLSFTGILHEEGIFNLDEFFLLEWALYKLHKDNVYNDFLYWKIFRVFSLAFGEMLSHFNANDLFIILNAKDIDLRELTNRFQLVFEGYFQKEMPDLKICFPDLKNHYLTDDLLS
jgi:hypothetical protein